MVRKMFLFMSSQIDLNNSVDRTIVTFKMVQNV